MRQTLTRSTLRSSPFPVSSLTKLWIRDLLSTATVSRDELWLVHERAIPRKEDVPAVLRSGSFYSGGSFLLGVVFAKGWELLLGHGEKPININNFSGLSRVWVGVKFVSVLPFSWAKRETHKQNPQEIAGKCRDSLGDNPGIILGQSRENFVYVFSCLLVFPAPIPAQLKVPRNGEAPFQNRSSYVQQSLLKSEE